MNSKNVTKQHYSISRTNREKLLGQRGHVFWLTGLSGSGKSTLADHATAALFELGKHAFVLDGDNTRMGLNKDLGFTSEDRKENLRRVAEVASLMKDTGLLVFCAFITPENEQRKLIQEIVGENDFSLIHVKCALEVCEERDIKGLYAKARAGEIQNFTGISAAFDEPDHYSLEIDTSSSTPEESLNKLMTYCTHVLNQQDA